MRQNVVRFIRKEPVQCIAALCAAVSCCFAPPSAAYLSYIDWRVLGLLFCLMAAVAGLTRAGLMERLSHALLKKAGTQRALVLLLTLLCFFCSMVMTNDVSLVAFVPLTLLLLTRAGLTRLTIPVVALETAAANLGSALTPVGNPQNLYLYSAYQLTPGEFFSVTGPLCAVSLVLCVAAALCVRAKGRVTVQADAPAPLDGKRLALHGALLALCIATVFSLVDWRVTLAVVAACLLLFDRQIFRRVDYALLATFACFFLFSGNLASLPPVRALLTSLMEKSAFFASLLASQVISNVPAALLLSPFTDDARAMLLGTDVGGLGTLVASLASLISYKYYARSEGANSGRYLLWFTALNLLLLLPLIALSLLLLA